MKIKVKNNDMKQGKTSCLDFLWYALYAFAGLGAELVLVGAVEPVLFEGVRANDYSTVQKIIHLIITILCWGGIAWVLIKGAKNKLGFDVVGCNEVKRVNVIYFKYGGCYCVYHTEFF